MSATKNTHIRCTGQDKKKKIDEHKTQPKIDQERQTLCKTYSWGLPEDEEEEKEEEEEREYEDSWCDINGVRRSFGVYGPQAVLRSSSCFQLISLVYDSLEDKERSDARCRHVQTISVSFFIFFIYTCP